MVEGSQQDRGDRLATGRNVGGSSLAAALEPAGGVFGQGEQFPVRFEERRRPIIDALDKEGELLPAVLGEREVGAEIEEVDLADAGAGADGFAEAVGEAGAALGRAGLGAADKHAARDQCGMPGSEDGANTRRPEKKMALHSGMFNHHLTHKSNIFNA